MLNILAKINIQGKPHMDRRLAASETRSHRKGERPHAHLKDFSSTLQADGYVNFHHLFAAHRIQEAG